MSISGPSVSASFRIVDTNFVWNDFKSLNTYVYWSENSGSIDPFLKLSDRFVILNQVVNQVASLNSSCQTAHKSQIPIVDWKVPHRGALHH